MGTGIVEIRDYTIETAWLKEYKVWAEDLAAPWLKRNLDVIDFWVDTGLEAEVSGSNPIVSSNGQANVCWIIRWRDKAHREAVFRKTMAGSEWQEIWSKHPNAKAYLHMNVRFMESLG